MCTNLVQIRIHAYPYISNQHQAIQRNFEPIGLTLLKNPLGARWGLLSTLRWVASWLPTYLPSFFLPSSREKILQRESKHQPLHSEMGTSPLSPGSLQSSCAFLYFYAYFPYFILQHSQTPFRYISA